MDLRLVKGMMKRQTFNLLYPMIPRDLVSPHTLAILHWQRAYFRTYKGVEEITPKALSEYVALLNKDTLDTEEVKLTLQLIKRLDSVPDQSNHSLYEALIEERFAGQMGKLVASYQSGDEIDIIAEGSEIARTYSSMRGIQLKETASIEDILKSMESREGIVVEGVPMFEDYFEPFQEGMSICVAGRPDRGKTTLLSFLVTRMARTAIEYCGEHRPILWLVNEGHQDRILPRIYQAGLSCTLDEMYDMLHAGTLRDKYAEAIHAPSDYIKVLPIHGKTMADIELIVQNENPSVVVIDMVEHIGGVQGGSKTEVVGNTWEKLRSLALIYGFLHIGTAQISVEGSDNLFPDYSSIAWTKTAVQGYTDMILMMGNRELEGYENIRGLSSPKNKSKVQGKTSYPRIEFEVDFDRCMFYQKGD